MAALTSQKHPDLVNINVGGTLFTTTHRTLKSVPDTRLSNISPTSGEYIPEHNVYYFDRNPQLFNHVLDFYRTGELHLPKHVCGAAIRTELEYWQLASGSIADCCVASLFKFEDDLEVSKNLRAQFESKILEYTREQLERSKWNRIKNIIWSVLEKSASSRFAQIYSIIYMLFVVTTCITFILSTHEKFRQNIPVHLTVNGNQTLELYDYLIIEHGTPKLAVIGSTELLPSLKYLNYICTLFFMLELLLRFICCPRKREFFKNWLNVVDLIIVFCLAMTFILQNFLEYYKSKTLLWLFIIGKGCVVLRLLRLFRFAKHFGGLKILYLSLKASSHELGLLCLTFVITTAIFGAFIYYAEFYQASSLDNIPIGIWWAIVTLTTVGYGDYYPITTPGYIIGAMCGMCGLLLLSMPIAIIATNFNDYYFQNKIREKQIIRKKELMNKIKKLFSNQNAVAAFHLDTIPIQDTPREDTNNTPDTQGSQTMLVQVADDVKTKPETKKTPRPTRPRRINVAFQKATANVITKKQRV